MLRSAQRRYHIDEAEPGMELARSLMAETGRYALSEGTVLTSSLIERLKNWGVDYIDVRVATEDAEQAPVILPPKQQALSDDYNDTAMAVKRSFEMMRFAKQVPLKEIEKVAEEAIVQLIDTFGILNHLQVVERQDDYTYHHSINVAILCGIIGRWLGYEDDDFRELVLAGLLHDIGKTQIPLDIVRKTGFLSELEMDIMKKHTTRGYKLVKDLGLPQRVLYAILQHHEREDGSGYPLKVTGDKIHPFAKIVAIADVYDAMTSDKVYRQKTTPFHAVDAIKCDMYDKLDPNICAVFMSNLRDYFVGNIVELNDGREAEVVYLGRLSSARPIVRTDSGEFIDLEQEKRISIVKLVRT